MEDAIPVATTDNQTNLSYWILSNRHKLCPTQTLLDHTIIIKITLKVILITQTSYQDNSDTRIAHAVFVLQRKSN